MNAVLLNVREGARYDERVIEIPLADLQITNDKIRDGDGETVASLTSDGCWETPEGLHWTDVVFRPEAAPTDAGPVPSAAPR